MRTTSGPRTTIAHEIPAAQEVVVFRIVKTDDRKDPALPDSFRSNYESGLNARGLEKSWTVVHMGISIYLDGSAARATAQAWWPKIGQYIAEVRLEAGHGFNFADTGPPQHLTIWGDPVKLRDAVVNIRPV